MDIFGILKHLYTNKKLDWIKDINNPDIQPFVIQKWLVMNDKIRVQVRWLDKYVFALQDNPKMYLTLAWSIIPKEEKTPFCKYIKQEKDDDAYEFIIKKIRKQYFLSDNDMKYLKDILINCIEEDKMKWFSYYGIERKYWRAHQLNYLKLKELGTKRKDKTQKGLAAWGL